MDPYKTVYKGDFLWPYLLPVYERPPKPPEESSRKPIFIQENSILERKMCQCDRHSWSSHFKRAVQLKMKEDSYREAMIATAYQRTILENEILDHPCSDSDDIIASLYQLNFAKKNFPITGYRALHADHDDPVATPIAMLRPTITSNYRDPTTFNTVAFKAPNASAPTDLTLVREDQVDSIETPKTEYQDTIEKMALFNLFSSQGFREPMITSRIKPDCFCK